MKGNMAKKKQADKLSVGDVVTIPTDYTVVAIGPLDEHGQVKDPASAEVSLTPVDPHVTHLTKKLSELSNA